MKKLLIIIGTRPNFIKVTQFKKEAKNFPELEVVIAHTGQHYDKNMSEVFFEQFNLQPDFFLNIQGSSVGVQIGDTIRAIDEVVDKVKPILIIAVGDVNSTLCASIVANKRNILLAHLESGLRSNDRSMPEEINRILTDEIADYFFTTEASANENLLEENKSEKQIHFVGNTMIDTMVAFEKEIEASNILEKIGATKKAYILLTMHRPSNVDNKEGLIKLLDLLQGLSKESQVIFPIHPRTLSKLKTYGFLKQFEDLKNVTQLEPLDYFGFQKLIAYASLVITDSGGIQEETTFKRIPCLTIRDNTERPVTISEGTNELVKFDVDFILNKAKLRTYKTGTIPELWDGNATQRILEAINSLI